MDGGSATPVASGWTPNRQAHRNQRGARSTGSAVPKDSERRTSEASACDVVTGPRLAPTMGPRARSSSYSPLGSSRTDGSRRSRPSGSATAGAAAEIGGRDAVPDAPADDGAGRPQDGGRGA